MSDDDTPTIDADDGMEVSTPEPSTVAAPAEPPTDVAPAADDELGYEAEEELESGAEDELG
jgi:hypothetical protein